MGKGETRRALETYRRAYELIERYRFLAERVFVLTGMGSAEFELGEKEKAVTTFKRAVEAVEPMRASLIRPELRTSFFEARLDLYNQLVVALVELGRGNEAYHYVERARARAFLDFLGTKVSLANKRDEGIEKEELALRAKVEAAALHAVAEAGSLGAPVAEAPEGVAAGTRAVEEGLGRHRDILVRIKKESPEFASLVSVDPLKIEEVQRLLEPGVMLLEYFLMPKRTLLWVLTSEERRVLSLPVGKAELEERVRALRHAIETRAPVEDYRGLARDLYDRLIQPAKAYLKGRHLILVPHLVLHYVPFGALLSPEGRYLLEEFPLSFIPSGSILKFALEKRRKVGERVLALGNPDLGDPRLSLPFAEREVKAISTLFPETSLHIRQEASKEKVISLGHQFDVLHFATDAEFNDVSPLHSSLRLAPGDEGRLEVHEIFRLDLRAALVTLSACQTGIGKVSAGDEVTSLHRAFLYAGTPSVVASLWRVDDEATGRLMVNFYRHLRERPKGEALRQAQLEASRAFPHPFYWAAFSLTGDYQ